MTEADDDCVWSCPVHGTAGCPLDCRAANAHMDELDELDTDEAPEEGLLLS